MTSCRPNSPRSRSHSAVVLLTVFVILLTLALAAVPGCRDRVTLDSGIDGEVTIGPLSPVVSAGQEDDSRPYSAVIRIKSVPEGELVAQTTSDEQGRFRVALAPGLYLVEPEQGDPLPTASPQEVTVVEGEFTRVRVNYDSGIR